MGIQRISVRGHTTASPEEVYELLRDGASWPEWSPLGSFRLIREGNGAPEGLGALRFFRTGRIKSCEEIVELVPARRFSYVLRSGLPLRGYRADVDLTPDDGGTEIHWHSAFAAKIPGTGWLYRRTLASFIRRCVDGLVAATSATGVRPAP
ncbi:SRPBCC family protein [Amycolatopsis sp. NPDC059021]|uniref:SRPBCC family protein n=1 Tax=Amycolatopsis sp. NPDC059021 TaxID=3346704 RepID=UPI0036731B4B